MKRQAKFATAESGLAKPFSAVADLSGELYSTTKCSNKGRIAMSDKALNPATLELTQKIQLHFPREIQANSLRAWNGASAELLTARLL